MLTRVALGTDTVTSVLCVDPSGAIELLSGSNPQHYRNGNQRDGVFTIVTLCVEDVIARLHCLG